MPSTRPMRTDSAAATDDARSPVQLSSCPALARHIRLSFDRARDRHVLLGPESVSMLNGTGAAILGLCDGQRTVAEIAEQLRERYDRVVDDEVLGFLCRLVANRWVELRDG